MPSSQEILESLKILGEAWCDRRCFSALAHILSGYPLSSGLTDDWAGLLEALKNVKAFTQKELTIEEKQKPDKLIDSVSRIVYR